MAKTLPNFRKWPNACFHGQRSSKLAKCFEIGHEWPIWQPLFTPAKSSRAGELNNEEIATCGAKTSCSLFFLFFQRSVTGLILLVRP